MCESLEFNHIGLVFKHEKKFFVSALKADARIRDYDGAFEWLKGAMTVNICYGASRASVCVSTWTGRRLNQKNRS